MNAEKVLKLAYSMSLDYRECCFDLQMTKIIVIEELKTKQKKLRNKNPKKKYIEEKGVTEEDTYLSYFYIVCCCNFTFIR
jgi:hypothetical protein